MSDTAPAPRVRSATRTITVLTLVHAALISTLLLMFAWPAATAAPRDIPIGLVGPAPVVAQLSERIEAQQEGALDIVSFDTAADAEVAITERDIYGAIVLSEAPQALVASAASPAIAQLLTDLTRTVAESSAAQSGMPVVSVQVTDVVSFPEADPRGVVFGLAALPLVIGGISLAAFAVTQLRSLRARAALVAVGSLVTGFSLAGILTALLGALPGPFALSGLAVSATLAAMALSLVGAHAVLGFAGFGTVAAVLFLLGNPLSGTALPVEFYLAPWGAVGQAMPVGAGFDLLRTINFFDTAPTTEPWIVLASWMSAGLIILGLSSRVRSRPRRQP